MSHQIIKGIDTVYTPNAKKWAATWHGLETMTEEDKISFDGSNIPNVLNPMIECGLNPTLPEGMEINSELQTELDSWKLIAADCREGLSGKIHPVHIPREGYAIHQNSRMFECMVQSAKTVLGAEGFEIVTAGTLDGYRQFFVSISIKGKDTFNVGNLSNGIADNYQTFFNLLSSHNGVHASQFMQSYVRMVCMNTVQAAIKDSNTNGTNQKVKHTKNSEENITPESFAESLQQWTSDNESYKYQLLALKAEPMNLAQFKSFSAGVLSEEKSDKLSTNSANRIDEMESLFVKGQGNSGESRYDALNAFTEFFTSGNGVGKKSTASQKVARANFGRGADWKNEAFRVLTDAEEFKKSSERGEMLLHDRDLLKAASN